jgi:hypothetical protein
MEKSGRNPIPITFPTRDDAAKIKAYEIIMDILRDQLALEMFFLKQNYAVSHIDDSRAGASKRIVEDIVYPAALIDISQAVRTEELARETKATKRRARKSPAKKSQSPKRSPKRDA